MRKLTVEEEERCKISLAQNLHEHMLSNRDEWLILGDETGGLKEFGGQNPHRPSRMMWIAIPPNVTLPPLHPFENCSLVVNVPCPKFTPRQFSASRRASGACAARGPPGARTPRRKRAIGRRAATDATHDAADAGNAGPVRPPALGAGRAAAWHAAHASVRCPRVLRNRRGVGSPRGRRGQCGTSATSGTGRRARRRLAGGACDCSHPACPPAPTRRGVASRVCHSSRIGAV